MADAVEPPEGVRSDDLGRNRLLFDLEAQTAQALWRGGDFQITVQAQIEHRFYCYDGLFRHLHLW